MDADDVMKGRVLSRREVMALIGAAGLSTWAERAFGQEAGALGQTGQVCIVQPQQTEGPYFVDQMLNRSDIRADPATGAVKAGVPLRVSFSVGRMTGEGACVPLPSAQVDLWHCDALGVYSDVRDAQFDTVGQRFLRGHQQTDARGLATFETIYPGWYRGRAVHLHFKIRTTPQRGGTPLEFTSQIYFEDELTDVVHGRAPYAERGRRTTRNSGDSIFRRGGTQLTLPLREASDGYEGTFNIALT